MASKKIKIGIAGIGRAGWGMHCPELDHYKDLYEIVAACDGKTPKVGCQGRWKAFICMRSVDEFARNGCRTRKNRL